MKAPPLLWRFFVKDEDDMPTPQSGDLQRTVGRIEEAVDNLHEDMLQFAIDLKQSMLENQRILQKLDKLENKVDPLPGAVSKHGERIGELEDFRGNLMAVVALGGIAASAIGAGMWMLILHFTDVIAFAKKLFGGAP